MRQIEQLKRVIKAQEVLLKSAYQVIEKQKLLLKKVKL